MDASPKFGDAERGLIDAPALRSKLRAIGRATLRISGASMSPLLPDGTQVELRRIADKEKLSGAIVAIDFGAKVVVHKVVAHHGDSVHTQGIVSRERDLPVTLAQVIGVVCAINGRGRRSEARLRLKSSALMLSLRGVRALKDRW